MVVGGRGGGEDELSLSHFGLRSRDREEGGGGW